MKNLMSSEWWLAAGTRAAKTVIQAGGALLLTQLTAGTVDLPTIAEAALLAGIASFGTSLAGLPELEQGE